MHQRAEAREPGIEGVRRDHEPAHPRFQARDLVERTHLLGRLRKVDQQHVASGDRAFDAGQEHDSPVARPIGQPRVSELAIVEGDGERVEAQRGGAVDERGRVVADVVARVLGGVKVKVYFEHVVVTLSGRASSPRATLPR